MNTPSVARPDETPRIDPVLIDAVLTYSIYAESPRAITSSTAPSSGPNNSRSGGSGVGTF